MNRILLLAFLITVTPSIAFGGRIALTFDDAPRENSSQFTTCERAATIIKKLKKAGVPQVAIFTKTKNIVDSSKKKCLKLYADAGHLIGNHSHSHICPDTIGTEKYIQDIERADQMLSTMKGFTKWYRYPYLDKGETQESRDKIWIAIQKMGYFDAYITVETFDWHPNSVLNQALHEKKQVNLEAFKNLYISHVWRMIQFHDDLAQKVLDRSPKHVLLLHENDLAALFIDDLIADIRSKGWEIISPQEAYSDPIAIQERDTTFRYQNRLVAIARFKKYQYIRPNELNTGYLDGLIADAGAVKMVDK